MLCNKWQLAIVVLLMGCMMKSGFCIEATPPTQTDPIPSALLKLPFEIASCRHITALPTEYYLNEGENEPLERLSTDGALSPDGNRMIWDRYGVDPRERRIDIVNITDGTVLPSPFLREHVQDIVGLAWDQVSKDALYVSMFQRLPGDQVREEIWHINIDGANAVVLSNPTENASLVGISGDGRYLIAEIGAFPEPFNVNTMPLQRTVTLIPTANFAQRIPVSDIYWLNNNTFAPNTDLIASSTRGDSHTIDFYTVQLANHVAQTTYLTPPPHPFDQYFTSLPMWLADSSGVLITVPETNADTTPPSAVWLITASGEARKVASGVAIIAHSANGKHWIFCCDAQWYYVKEKAARNQ